MKVEENGELQVSQKRKVIWAIPKNQIWWIFSEIVYLEWGYIMIFVKQKKNIVNVL